MSSVKVILLVVAFSLGPNQSVPERRWKTSSLSTLYANWVRVDDTAPRTWVGTDVLFPFFAALGFEGVAEERTKW
jgi:hypothetical protein